MGQNLCRSDPWRGGPGAQPSRGAVLAGVESRLRGPLHRAKTRLDLLTRTGVGAARGSTAQVERDVSGSIRRSIPYVVPIWASVLLAAALGSPSPGAPGPADVAARR